MKRIVIISVFCFQLSAFSQPGFGPDDLAILKPAAASAPSSITFIAATTNNFSGTSTVLDLPTGTASGDLLMVFICTDAFHQVNSWPSGYSEVTNNTLGLAGFSVSYKVADGTETSTQTFGFTAGVVGVSILICYRGGNATAPFENQASDASVATPQQTPALLPAGDNSMIVGAIFRDPAADVTFSEISGFPLRSVAVRTANGAIAIADKLQTTATSEGVQIGESAGGTWGRYTMVIAP